MLPNDLLDDSVTLDAFLDYLTRSHMDEIERRTVPTGEVRMMEDESKPGKIRGYAARFNAMSEPMWGFRERILPGAFAGVLKDDVRALFNHSPDSVLGRTASGTLRIGEDDQGLWYEIDLPDTTLGRDLAELVRRGDVSQSSFGFTVLDDERKIEDGEYVRVIKAVKRLYDVSPVTYPAYTQTTAKVRSWAQGTTNNQPFDAGLARRRLDLIELEED